MTDDMPKIACIHCRMSMEDHHVFDHRHYAFGEPMAPCLDGHVHKFDFAPLDEEGDMRPALEMLATVPAHETLQ